MRYCKLTDAEWNVLIHVSAKTKKDWFDLRDGKYGSYVVDFEEGGFLDFKEALEDLDVGNEDVYGYLMSKEQFEVYANLYERVLGYRPTMEA